MAGLMDSPPPLPHLRFSGAKSIQRVLMAPAKRDTDPFKWPAREEEEEEAKPAHLQSWQKTIQERRIIASAFPLFIYFYLKTVQMFVYWFNASCNGPGEVVCVCQFLPVMILFGVVSFYTHTHTHRPPFHPTTRQASEKKKNEGQADLSTPQNRILTTKQNFIQHI